MRKSIGIFAIAVSISALLTACAQQMAPRQSLEELMEMGIPESYSRFDKAGKEQILASKAIRMDIRDLALRGEDLGVSPRLTSPLVGGADSRDLLLVIDGPTGQILTTTQTLMFGSGDAEGYRAVNFFRSFETLEEATADLFDPQWGFSGDQVEEWRVSMDKPDHSTRKQTFTLGFSPAGLVTEVTARVREDRSTLIIYTILLFPDLYIPDAVSNIIDHGDERPRSNAPKFD